MSDLARLVVRLEANIGQYTAQLGKANQQLASFEQKANKSVDAISTAFKRIVTGAVLLKLGQSLVRMADDYTTLGNKLRLVTSSSENLDVIQSKLFDSAQRTRTGLGETVELYARIARSTERFGISQREVLEITEAVNQAIIIGGANSREAAAGVVQFGQALASNRLGGDELRSVMEQMPRLAKALADGLGVDIGQLRKMGEAGELGTKKLAAAVRSQVPKLGGEFKQLDSTIDQALTKLSNSFLKFFGELNKSGGVSIGFAKAISAVADSVETLAKSLLVAAVAAATFKGSLVVTSIVQATSAFIGLFNAVRKGDFVLLGSAEAERQRAAAALASARIEAARTASQLAAVDAEIAQAGALAQTTAAMVGNNAAIIVNAQGQAVVANASRASAAAAVEQARAEVARRTAIVTGLQAQVAQAAAMESATAAATTNSAAIAVNTAGQANLTRAEAAAISARQGMVAQAVAAAAVNRTEAVSAVALARAQLEQATTAAAVAQVRVAASAQTLTLARANLAAAVSENSRAAATSAATIVEAEGLAATGARIAARAELTAATTAVSAAEARLAEATAAAAASEASAAAAANTLSVARVRLTEANVAAGAAQAVAATAANASIEAQVALQTELAAAEAGAAAAGNTLATAEARLAATTTEANVATFAQVALEKQRAAAQAQSAAAATALAGAEARVAATGAASAGSLGVLRTGFLGILGPLRGVIALVAANPITAAIAAIAAVVSALYIFRNDIKTSADGVVTLRDTAVAAFQIIAEAIAPVTSAIATGFRAAMGTLKSVFSTLAESMARVNDGLKNMAFLIPYIGTTIMAVEAVQKRARKIAEERQKTAFLKALAGEADSIIGEITGQAKPSAPDDAALKKVKELVASMRQQIIAQDQGAVSAINYRIKTGDLADEFKKLGDAGEKYKGQLVALTREQEAMKIGELAKDLKQQVATFDETAMSVLRYRMQFGDLKNTVKDAGAAGKKFVDDLLKQQATLDGLQIAKQLKDISASVLELQGLTVEAVAIRFDTQNMMLVKQLTEQHNVAGLEQLKTLRELTIAQAEFTKAQEENDRKASILEIKGDTGAATALRFDTQNMMLVKQLTDQNNVAELEQLNTLRSLTIAQAQFNELQEKAGRIKTHLAQAEEQIQNSVKVGAITAVDALQRTGEERAKTVVQLQEIIDKNNEIAAGAGKSSVAIVEGAKAASAELETLKTQTNLLGEAAEKDLKESFASAFGDLVKGAKTAGEAIAAFFQDLQRRILESAANNLAEQIFGGFSESAGGWLGSFGKLATDLLQGSSSAGAGAGGLSEVVTTVARIPTKDSGGRGYPGQAVLIGRGAQPEMYVPDQAGKFFPSGTWGQQQPIQVTNHFNIAAPQGTVSRQTQMQVGASAARGLELARRRNG